MRSRGRARWKCRARQPLGVLDHIVTKFVPISRQSLRWIKIGNCLGASSRLLLSLLSSSLIHRLPLFFRFSGAFELKVTTRKSMLARLAQAEINSVPPKTDTEPTHAAPFQLLSLLLLSRSQLRFVSREQQFLTSKRDTFVLYPHPKLSQRRPPKLKTEEAKSSLSSRQNKKNSASFRFF